MAYNFVRPHEALDGKTPAEMAGLGLNLGENKWLGLMKKAQHHTCNTVIEHT